MSPTWGTLPKPDSRGAWDTWIYLVLPTKHLYIGNAAPIDPDCAAAKSFTHRSQCHFVWSKPTAYLPGFSCNPDRDDRKATKLGSLKWVAVKNGAFNWPGRLGGGVVSFRYWTSRDSWRFPFIFNCDFHIFWWHMNCWSFRLPRCNGAVFVLISGFCGWSTCFLAAFKPWGRNETTIQRSNIIKHESSMKSPSCSHFGYGSKIQVLNKTTDCSLFLVFLAFFSIFFVFFYQQSMGYPIFFRHTKCVASQRRV